MPVDGAGLVAKNIIAFGGRFRDEIDRDMVLVKELLDGAVRKNISLTDHTLADLAALGHPYGRKNPQRLHDPGYQVHSQSGRLLASKFSGTDKAGISGGRVEASAYVGVSDSVEYAASVIFGTSKMVSRDFLVGSLGEVRDKALSLLKRSLGQAVVSFNGQTERL